MVSRVSPIGTKAVDSLKAVDPGPPNREADISQSCSLNFEREQKDRLSRGGLSEIQLGYWSGGGQSLPCVLLTPLCKVTNEAKTACEKGQCGG